LSSGRADRQPLEDQPGPGDLRECVLARPSLKERSLRIGAATQKALETTRSAFNQDLDALILPVLEPAREHRGARAATPTLNPPEKTSSPARSILGPPDV